MLTIIKAPVRGYAEESQNHDVKFSFANRKNDSVTEVFSGVKCRDFLGDALFAEEFGITTSIWSFSYDPNKMKIDRDKLRFVISTNKDHSKYLTKIKDNIKLFHLIESYHNLEATYLERLDETNMLLEASNRWMLTNYLISYYTFLVKAASYEYKDVMNWRKELSDIPGAKEGSYMKRVDKRFDSLTKNLFSICDEYKGTTGLNKTTNIGIVHNNTGFVSMCTQEPKTSPYHTKFASM